MKNPMEKRVLIRAGIITAAWIGGCIYLCRANGLGWGLTAFFAIGYLRSAMLSFAVALVMFREHERGRSDEEWVTSILKDLGGKGGDQ